MLCGLNLISLTNITAAELTFSLSTYAGLWGSWQASLWMDFMISKEITSLDLLVWTLTITKEKHLTFPPTWKGKSSKQHKTSLCDNILSWSDGESNAFCLPAVVCGSQRNWVPFVLPTLVNKAAHLIEINGYYLYKFFCRSDELMKASADGMWLFCCRAALGNANFVTTKMVKESV